MESLPAWFTKADRERSLHPLLLIGSFIGSFIVVFLADAESAEAKGESG